MHNLFVAGAILAAMALSPCNTIEGAGRDISSAGNAVAQTAKDAK